jgi:hypothetical protein
MVAQHLLQPAVVLVYTRMVDRVPTDPARTERLTVPHAT